MTPGDLSGWAVTLRNMPANGRQPRLSGHTVAGFLDAEACFQIVERNGGRSFATVMSVALRDDDAELLQDLVATVDAGFVRDADKRGNPQAAWRVQRMADAERLVAFLDRYPLRSRKRADYLVWRSAVELWNGTHPDRFVRVGELSRDIRAARAYRAPEADAVTALAREGFDDWLAGFVAGDGSLSVRGGSVRLTVRLRADDRPVLAGIAAKTGLGKVAGPYPNEGSKPVVCWNVCSVDDLVAVAARLDGRIPGKKAREFELWRKAVQIRADRALPRERRLAQLADIEQQLREMRRYRPGAPLPSTAARRLRRTFEQNRDWIALIQSWAASEPGPLTSDAYQRARQPGWPSRNTLAARFWSWYGVLLAAGVEARAALLPAARDRRTAGARSGQARRRQETRERILTAVRRCTVALGHVPGPTEYARWRFHNEPSAPSLGTAYVRFPGGWRSVQEALAD